MYRVFGNESKPIFDGICGASIVDIESGGVAGFYHQSDGVHAYSSYVPKPPNPMSRELEGKRRRDRPKNEERICQGNYV
jgi:hypothetical protein